jgi:hypothetical protein
LQDPLTWLFALEQFGIKFGLENISAIVERLGHPERAFRSIHIAGTNGKGSVTAMVDAALRAAGHRSARFTSPHLIDLSERFGIDGTDVEYVGDGFGEVPSVAVKGTVCPSARSKTTALMPGYCWQAAIADRRLFLAAPRRAFSYRLFSRRVA